MKVCHQKRTGRRNFLKTSAKFAAATLLAPTLVQADKADKNPYGDFKMGIQSYSLRGFSRKKALEHSKTLGLHYWEAYPKHLPLSTDPKVLKQYHQQLENANVTMVGYGVVPFGENETEARKYFEFAKAMKARYLSADPKKTKTTFDLLDKLVAEYDVAIAIHNHGPHARYDKISDVEKMVQDRHPKVGACVDTGHFIRSDEDPVEAIERFGKRVFGVHLKDVKTTERNGKKQKIFTVLGQGDLNVVGSLKALKKIAYHDAIALEYEENPDNPLSDIEACLRVVRIAVKKVNSTS